MNRFKVVAMSLVLCLVAMGFSIGAQADEWNKQTTVTFTQPVEVPGAGAQVLPPGTYVFKLVDSMTNRNIVRITNADQTHVFTTILAISNSRLHATDNTVMTFRERAAGQPEAIRAWFYPGDTYGQEFVYPKSRALALAKVVGEPVLAMPLEEEPTVEALKTVPVEAVTPTGEVVPAAQVVEPETTVASLPQTSSLLPLVGLLGLLSLGVSFTLGAFAKRTV
jgi:hypothetical protein